MQKSVKKKKAANWRIALIHFITVGFIVFFAVPFFLSFALFNNPALSFLVEHIWLTIITGLVFESVILWFTILYSANFLKKRYLIKDKNKVVNFSTLYLMLAESVPLAFNISIFGLTPKLIGPFVVILIFYIGSKKYIEETPIQEKIE